MAKIRVAYAGHDFFSSCLDALLRRADVEVVLCLTSHPEHTVRNVVGLAHESRVPVVFGRPTEKTVSVFNLLGVDLLVSAAYLYRIPIEELKTRWAINIHPSLLPHGRGPDPLPYLVDGHRELAGLSIHEITPEFDQGPILLQEAVPVDDEIGRDQLFLKLFAIAPRLLGTLLDDIDAYFSAKRDQGAGSYWPEHRADQRVLDATRARVHDAVGMRAKFGAAAVLVELADEERVEAAQLVAAECGHDYPPGTVVARLEVGWVIALTDGLMRVATPIR